MTPVNRLHSLPHKGKALRASIFCGGVSHQNRCALILSSVRTRLVEIKALIRIVKTPIRMTIVPAEPCFLTESTSKLPIIPTDVSTPNLINCASYTTPKSATPTSNTHRKKLTHDCDTFFVGMINLC